MTETEDRIAAYKACVEEYLTAFYGCLEDTPQKYLAESVRYSLLSGGKRLRPTLVFEFCRVCGGDWKAAAPFAAAVEMIHTYSLIHDELPCMDNDDYRRGRLTNHKVYGEAMAVLAGDARLTDAFAGAASAQIPNPADLARAIGVLAENAGSLGMVGGQVLDMLSEERVCTEQEVLDIQTRKTGGLINAACVLGVIAAGGTEAQIQAAAQFAAGIGLAFQIRDDMLVVIGSRQELGKAVGVDEKKTPFVRLYGLEECGNLVNKYTNLAVSALDAFESTDFLKALALEMTGRMK